MKLKSIFLKPGHPEFLDLPWGSRLGQWEKRCNRWVDLPHGVSRHPVVFVNYEEGLYALKEMEEGMAEREYRLLCGLEELKLPVVQAVGHVSVGVEDDGENSSVLITRYLDHSMPYLSLFTRGSSAGYQEHLLDAMAGLLVQLHLAGVFWGDCSLSNTLFRRDAGALQAYLVDAETVEIRPGLSPGMREHDLEIMAENVTGGLADLVAGGILHGDFPVFQMGESIRERYMGLWNEITREVFIAPEERYKIHERIKALNDLGFSVKEIELNRPEKNDSPGNQLRLKVAVTDLNFHRHQLHSFTGLEVEENQARRMMHEVHEVRASLMKERNHSIPLSVAAYHWLNEIYRPVMERLKPVIADETDPGELYSQFLDHKWYLSEKARRDVGHMYTANDFLTRPPCAEQATD